MTSIQFARVLKWEKRVGIINHILLGLLIGVLMGVMTLFSTSSSLAGWITLHAFNIFGFASIGIAALWLMTYAVKYFLNGKKQAYLTSLGDNYCDGKSVQLEKIQKWEKYEANWDGEGGKVVSKVAIENLKKILHLLYDNMIFICPCRIEVGKQGQLNFEFHDGNFISVHWFDGEKTWCGNLTVNCWETETKCKCNRVHDAEWNFCPICGNKL